MALLALNPLGPEAVRAQDRTDFIANTRFENATRIRTGIRTATEDKVRLIHSGIDPEHRWRDYSGRTQGARSRASSGFDASYYHLDLSINFEEKRINGTTTIAGTFSSGSGELKLDLLSNLVVESVREDTTALAFTHDDDVLAINLGRTSSPGELVTISVEYGGRPMATGFGAFRFDELDGHPVAWTLSEPYGSRAWWPGKDHPSDKADSARVTVTVPEDVRVASNGLLAGITSNPDSTTTYNWVTRYPIAPYLLSVAIGPYVLFDQLYVRPDSLVAELGPLSMPVVHYKYPTNGSASLPEGWAEVIDALAVLEWWFGPYPFAEEKYGHAEFGWGGGMEHQTMTSMGGTSVGLMVHELAHQWFGDAVTTETWPHLWLNEGFATYAEVLYWETMNSRYPGIAELTISGDQRSARSANGTLVVEDTSTVSNLFAGSRVYAKGSAVLHMLRAVLGDEDFRTTLQTYITDPDLAYATAVTADLQRIAETVSGRSLDAFFQQWVTEGTGHPTYAVEYSSTAVIGGFDLGVRVQQQQTDSESNIPAFVMPIELSVQTPDGEERFLIENNLRDQTYRLRVNGSPIAVELDPDSRLLRNDPVRSFDTNPRFPIGSFVISTAPNPVSDRLVVEIQPSEAGRLQVQIVNMLGQQVRILWDAESGTIPIRLETSVRDLPSGVYVLNARTGLDMRSRPIVVAH